MIVSAVEGIIAMWAIALLVVTFAVIFDYWSERWRERRRFRRWRR